MGENREPRIGDKLRALREQRGLSLRALADKCGLAFNTISRIEHNDSSPTVATLNVLANALDVPISAFFEDAYGRDIIVVKRGQGVRSSSSGVVMESLGVGLYDQKTDPFLVTVEPGAGSHQNPIAHVGEEFVHCLEGRLTYLIGHEKIELEPGDSLLFDATQPHCFCNRTQAPVRFLIVFYGVDSRHSLARHHPR